MWKENNNSVKKKRNYKKLSLSVFVVITLLVVSYLAYSYFKPQSIEEKIVNLVQFDESFTELEKQTVSSAIEVQQLDITGEIKAIATTSLIQNSQTRTMSVYLPVTNVYSAKQNLSSEEIPTSQIYFWHEIDPMIQLQIATAIGTDPESIKIVNSVDEIMPEMIAFVPEDILSSELKLLKLNDVYYLDEFSAGGIYRTAEFSGESANNISELSLNSLAKSDDILSINQTGVTALTRIMLRKLNEVKDPLYFSEFIGPFLADADITHISNEVSFREGCGYSNTSFCSDPRFIETLKDSGVDLVEITGNHNNDQGSELNTETINLYKSLGWNVFGGGLNSENARLFHEINQKNSKIAFLGYNYPDSPNGGAISGLKTAGANSFDFSYTKIKEDIDLAKSRNQFVIVDVQYWECYSYPDGYVEYPICDEPIGEQEEVFKQLVDLGADMIVGTQAHQPQTYEIYKGKPIYFGLGNLYFDQTSWPGTERGIILTHYFLNGELMQTKLSPTRYDTSLQTKLMNNSDSEELLARLQLAR